MTTTEPPGYLPPTGPPPPPPPPPGARNGRVLRRSRDGRVGAGVASGLGDYFGFDPVLFRVLFATSAFFGGAGVIAYLLAWAAIPEEGTARAPIDGWVGQLRRRRIPFWLVVIVGGVLLWLAAFSWWAPGPFLPVMAVVIILAVAFGRREWHAGTAPAAAPATGQATESATGPVNLTKDASDGARPGDPTWVSDARAWIAETQAASRERRRRSLPLRIGMLIAIVVALTVLGTIDAITGIALPIYFWTLLGIVVVGLLAGMVMRRTPWSAAVLLPPVAIGLVAFGGSHTSLHDGVGQREWKPVNATATSHYRLAFGQGELDLRRLPTLTTPQTIDVTLGAGQVRIIAPKSLNLTVLANIHIGQLTVDDLHIGGGHRHGHGGVGLSRTVDPATGATGAPITVDVHVAAGQIDVEHR